MKTLKRRIVAGIATAAAAVLLAGCANGDAGTPETGGTDGGSGELTTVRVGAFASLNGLSLRVADEQGFFEANGLQVEYVPMTQGSESIPQLIGNQLDFAMNDMVTITNSKVQNIPIQIVAPNSVADAPNDDNQAYVNVIIRAEDEGKFDSVADMAGATVGVPQINSQPWLDIRNLVEDAGGDPDAIEFVEVPNPLQAIRQGQVDFTAAPEPVGRLGVSEGDLAFFAPVSVPDLVGQPTFPYVAATEFIENNPETVQAFQDALIEANTWTNANPVEALTIAEGFLDMPSEVIQEGQLPALGESMPTDEEIQAVLDRIQTSGIIDEVPDVTAFVWRG